LRRGLIVILIAVIIAAVSGINETSLVLAQQPAPAGDRHETEIASRIKRIGVNHVVRIEYIDGSKFNALIEDVMPDSMTVLVLAGADRRRETIRFAEIKKVDEVRGHALRNVLIGAGIGFAVLVGACAASARTFQSAWSPVATDHQE
jgi:hypothetical protein